MFGRVTRPNHNTPAIVADLDVIPLAEAAIAVGHGVNALSKATEAGLVGLDRLLVPTGCIIEPHAIVRGLAPRIGRQHPARDIFQPAHPKTAVELARDPSSHADMVRMHVGDKNPRDRLAL